MKTGFTRLMQFSPNSGGTGPHFTPNSPGTGPHFTPNSRGTGPHFTPNSPGTGPHFTPNSAAQGLIKPLQLLTYRKIFTRMLNDRNQDIQPSHLSD